MNFIRDIVKHALETGYLTIEAEDKLRQMLRKKYGKEDFEAFMVLQQAAMAGKVKQQSRELIFAEHEMKSSSWQIGKREKQDEDLGRQVEEEQELPSLVCA